MSGSQFRLVLQREKTNMNRDNQRRRKAQAAAEPDLNSPVTEAEKKGRPPGQAALDWDVKRLETIAPWAEFEEGKGAKCVICVNHVGTMQGKGIWDAKFCTNKNMYQAVRKHKNSQYHMDAVSVQENTVKQPKHTENAMEKNFVAVEKRFRNAFCATSSGSPLWRS